MSYSRCSVCDSSNVEQCAVCPRCFCGFPLCSNCNSQWRSKTCPKCDTSYPDWKFIN